MRLFIFLLFLHITSYAQQDTRWDILNKNTLLWDVANGTRLPHSDNMEMAGQKVAGIITYSIDTLRRLSLQRHIFFPQFHPLLKATDPDWYVYRSYLQEVIEDDVLPRLYIDEVELVAGAVERVELNGTIRIIHQPNSMGLILKRTLFPSITERVFYEHWELQNTSDQTLKIRIVRNGFHKEMLTAEGKVSLRTIVDAPTVLTLKSRQRKAISLQIQAKNSQEDYPSKNATTALAERNLRMADWATNLVLETPDTVLNTMFQLAKIRAAESIFDSKLGLIHSPGGGRYYVGIWANDQAEYVSPLFPYLGYQVGNQSALNCYRAFAKEINPEYTKLPYAFEVEGRRPPSPLDRGDAAMIAYGASQFVLAYGKKEIAEELWELIEWCLEYNHRQLNRAGVVRSESDEMEGRIETGTANLSTSALYYGALDLAIHLASDLGLAKNKVKTYVRRKAALHKAIEKYFGATIEGLATYKYYDRHDKLRHWICLPLVVGINDRSTATTTALFDKLWSETGGVHVEKNNPNPDISQIFWDRGTLYALRGTFLAGATAQSLQKLQEYSRERLLGDRVPYAVEAYPEGNMAHLSAESGLYCRIFTEGMFGIVPTGLSSFRMTPRLPAEWDQMALRDVRAFGKRFDVVVQRADNDLIIKVGKAQIGMKWQTFQIKNGNSIEVSF